MLEYLLFGLNLSRLSFINEILASSALCDSDIVTDLFLPLAFGLKH